MCKITKSANCSASKLSVCLIFKSIDLGGVTKQGQADGVISNSLFTNMCVYTFKTHAIDIRICVGSFYSLVEGTVLLNTYTTRQFFPPKKVTRLSEGAVQCF